jgi:hypothetical protein
MVLGLSGRRRSRTWGRPRQLLAFHGVALLQRLCLLLVLGFHLRHRLRISLLRGGGSVVTLLLLGERIALLLVTSSKVCLPLRVRLLLIRGAFTGGRRRLTRGQVTHVHGGWHRLCGNG